MNCVALSSNGWALFLGFRQASFLLIQFLCSGLAGGFLNKLAISDQG
jgi:hypothetical protein